MVNDILQAGLRNEVVEVNFQAELEKHLSKNEEICENCGGLGMKVANNIFGIKGYKHTKGMTFPFNNQSLSYCPSCYNGIRKRCEHCNELIAKGLTVCDCETVRKQKADKEELEAQKRWSNIPKISLENALANYGMLYIEDFDEYVASDAFEDWIEYQRDEDEYFDPKDLRIYVTSCESISLSAADIVENALEELHEDAEVSSKATEQLQIFLDKWCKENSGGTQTYYADCDLGVIYSD